MDTERIAKVRRSAEAPRSRSEPASVRSRVRLLLKPVKSLKEILASWSLVYQSYRDAGLIEPNPQRIHTVPAATRPDALTVIARLRGELSATITAYPDASTGLPLDLSYPREMATLREHGHSLIEVGLLADRRPDKRSSLEAMLEMMKWAYFHGHYTSHSDLIIGVHPNHAKFYQRMFGFEEFGPETVCPIVNDAPVVGLRLNLQASLIQDPMPRGISHFVRAPVLATDIEGRYRLTRSEIRGSRIEAFLLAAGFPAAARGEYAALMQA
jgi:hypothetical protein